MGKYVEEFVMQQPVEFHKLFYTPVWRYEYPDYVNDAKYLLPYFTQDKLYLSEREKNGLQISRANLHKEEALEKLTRWVQECCESTMVQMGFQPECGITSMWATRQKIDGFHHGHSHANSFLGGVMHILDSDNCASGTVFDNSDCTKYVIRPAELREDAGMLKDTEHMPFVPGTLLIFPAWASHHTEPTESKYRVILGFNSMPIGMTTCDHFDRYNYPDPSNLKLKEYKSLSD